MPPKPLPNDNISQGERMTLLFDFFKTVLIKGYLNWCGFDYRSTGLYLPNQFRIQDHLFANESPSSLVLKPASFEISKN